MKEITIAQFNTAMREEEVQYVVRDFSSRAVIFTDKSSYTLDIDIVRSLECGDLTQGISVNDSGVVRLADETIIGTQTEKHPCYVGHTKDSATIPTSNRNLPEVVTTFLRVLNAYCEQVPDYMTALYWANYVLPTQLKPQVAEDGNTITAMQRGKLTTTKTARWLRKLAIDMGAQDEKQIAEAIRVATVQVELKVIPIDENITDIMVDNPRLKARSCMGNMTDESHNFCGNISRYGAKHPHYGYTLSHPYQVMHYPDTKWELALFIRGEDIIGRALLHDKRFVRCFEGSFANSDRLRALLRTIGAEPMRGWAECPVLYIEPPRHDGFIMPYIDGDCDRVDTNDVYKQAGTGLLMVNLSDEGNAECCSTSGLATASDPEDTCEDCGSDYDVEYFEDGDGVDRCLCSRCRRDFVLVGDYWYHNESSSICYSSWHGEYFHADDVTYVEDLDDYVQHYCAQEAVNPRNGYEVYVSENALVEDFTNADGYTVTLWLDPLCGCIVQDADDCEKGVISLTDDRDHRVVDEVTMWEQFKLSLVVPTESGEEVPYTETSQVAGFGRVATKDIEIVYPDGDTSRCAYELPTYAMESGWRKDETLPQMFFLRRGRFGWMRQYDTNNLDNFPLETTGL